MSRTTRRAARSRAAGVALGVVLVAGTVATSELIRALGLALPDVLVALVAAGVVVAVALLPEMITEEEEPDAERDRCEQPPGRD